MSDLFIFILLALLFFFNGLLLLRPWWKLLLNQDDQRQGRLELFFLAYPLGLGVAALVVFALAASQLLYLEIVIGLLLANGLFLLFKRKLFAIILGGREKFCSFQPTWFNLLVIIIFLLLAVNLSGALTPEVRSDPVDYHLNFPQNYVNHHGLLNTYWHALSFNPFNMEMIYTLSLLLGNDILAKLFHWSCGVWLIYGTFLLGRRVGGSWTGIWAALLLAMMPQFSYLSTTTYIDLGVSLWVLSALLVLVIHLKEQQTKTLQLAGIFTGLALGAKYTTIVVWLFPILLILCFTEVRSARKRINLKGVMIFCCIALIIFSPWLIKNFIFTGNPIYPILGGVVGEQGPGPTAAGIMSSGLSNFGLGEDSPWWKHLIEPLRMHLAGMNYAGTVLVNFYLLGLVGLAIFLLSGRRIKGDMRFIIAYTGLGLLGFVYLTSNRDGRFCFPVYPAMAVVTAWVMVKGFALVKSKPLKIIASSLLIMALAATLFRAKINFSHDFNESLLPVLSEDRQWDYKKQHFGLLPDYINNNLPPEAKILGIGFPVERRYISKLFCGNNPIDSVSNNYSGAELLERLNDLEVTHLVYPGGIPLDGDAVKELETTGQIKKVYAPGNTGLYEIVE